MKKTNFVLQKITALFVLTAVLSAVILSGSAFSAQSKQMTTQLFAEKLDAFKQNVYANGSTYVDDMETYRGTQCYGFANQIAQYFYGSFPTYNSTGLQPNADWTVTYGSAALQELHAGDVVRFRSSAAADHSIFITGMDEENVYFSDANNDHNNTVRHNAEMTWTKLIGKMDKALERDSSCVGWVAHYKYWDDDPDHVGIGAALSFNSNGGLIDGEQIADRYIVLDTLNMRSGPGLEYDRVTKMYDDTYFEVPCGSATTEADGYMWAQVKQSQNSGWSVINVEEWCKLTGPVMSSEYYVDGEDGMIYKSSDSKKYTITVGEEEEFPSAETFGLTYENAEFGGWSDQADGEPVSMQALLEKAQGEDLTLYAVWVKAEGSAGADENTDTGDGEEIKEDDTVKTRGDANNDGELNNKDVFTLFALLSSGSELDPDVCDVNEDGSVDNKDLVFLFRKLSSF